MNDYDSIDIALSYVVAQLQQINLFVGEVMSHVGKHGHTYVYGGNSDEGIFAVQQFLQRCADCLLEGDVCLDSAVDELCKKLRLEVGEVFEVGNSQGSNWLAFAIFWSSHSFRL